MKLVITVTDEKAATDTEALEGGAQAGAAPDGHRQTFDGGPVPDVLLSMESEVAAGQMPAPGRNL